MGKPFKNEVFKVFFIFITCTIGFYCGILWLNEYNDSKRYEPPSEGAMKVSVQERNEDKQTQMVLDRLKLFYRTGE